MEYLKLLNCCCKNNDKISKIKISCNLNCCKNKIYQINIAGDDVDKVLKLIQELEQKEIKK